MRSDNDLNSLARTLAKRLQNDLLAEEIALDDPRELKLFEIVIREAIDKTLEEAQAIVNAIGDEYRERQNREIGEELDDAISMTISANTCAAAIRSLKQSNSGMEASR